LEFEMESSKRDRVEAAGWRVGGAEEFLELTSDETQLVAVKLALGDQLRELRRAHRWTQTQVARRVGSSQSRVAKMEVADGSVSIDLLVKCLFALGASPVDVGGTIAGTA
jgi:DNA-binding XRE family transcriptional regulator